MKTNELKSAMVGALARATKKGKNGKRTGISYSLDFKNKLVSIIEFDEVYKEVVVHGHIGTGRKWKDKRWTKAGTPERVIFTGKASEALSFLDDIAATS